MEKEIWYELHTENQGFIGEVYAGEMGDDADEDDILDLIMFDISCREDDWENDTIYGIWNGYTITSKEVR